MLEIAHDMIAHGVRPDMNSCSILLMECEEQHQMLDLELELLRGLIDVHSASGTGLDSAVANAVVVRLLGLGQTGEALEVLRKSAEGHQWDIVSKYLWAVCGGNSALTMTWGPLLPRVGPHSVALRSDEAPYAKELSLLQHVLNSACPGEPATVFEAMDRFGREQWVARSSWSKAAGESKAGVLCAAFSGVHVDGHILEIGTYCGYTAIRMAHALRGVHLTTVEADPVHMVVARNTIALAGLGHRVEVLTGHSKNILPRLAANRCAHGRRSFAALFMDRWGSQYHEDFALLEHYNLLDSKAVVVTDNVLRTGASLFLWRVLSTTDYQTRIVRVQELATLSEDFMSVSVRHRPVRKHISGDPRSESHCTPLLEPPDRFLQLHSEAEEMRSRIFGIDRSTTVNEREEFASSLQAQMLDQLMHIGVAPVTSTMRAEQ